MPEKHTSRNASLPRAHNLTTLPLFLITQRPIPLLHRRCRPRKYPPFSVCTRNPPAATAQLQHRMVSRGISARLVVVVVVERIKRQSRRARIMHAGGEDDDCCSADVRCADAGWLAFGDEFWKRRGRSAGIRGRFETRMVYGGMNDGFLDCLSVWMVGVWLMLGCYRKTGLIIRCETTEKWNCIKHLDLGDIEIYIVVYKIYVESLWI